jgi:hypothetical protein
MNEQDKIIAERVGRLITLRTDIYTYIKLDGRENIYNHFNNSRIVNTILKEYDEKVLASQAIMQRAVIYKSAKHFML